MENVIADKAIISPLSLSKMNWFEEILEKSDNLKEEVVIKNVLDKDMIAKLLQLCDTSMSELCRLQALEYGFRVWKDDEQKNIHYIKKNVFANAQKESESIGDWMGRVLPDQQTCIIMNNVERFSDEIAQQMSLLFKPVMDHVGIPLNGLHSTSIFGNYEFTPLGIHHDSKGSFVMSLHLGPEEKEMYTWEWDHYLSLGGHDNDKNIEKYLPEAKKYILQPGDIYFMPWNKFHVGLNKGFSITMTNWFDFHSANRLMNDIVNFMGDTFIKLGKDFLSKPVTENNFRERFQNILNEFSFEGNRGEKSLKQNLLDAQEFKMLRTFSNCGWKSVPFSRKDLEGYDKMKFEHLYNTEIKSLYPFKIYSKVIDESIYIFVRGQIFKYDYQPEIDNVIDKLNSFQPVSVTELIQQDKPENWSEETFMYFLSSLYNFKGVEIAD